MAENAPDLRDAQTEMFGLLPGLRVTVQPASESADGLESWFSSTWPEIFGPGESGRHESPSFREWLGGSSGGTPSLFAVDGLPVGLLSYTTEGGKLSIFELATAPAYRDRGLGSEAVFTLEALSRAHESAAYFPITNGLAIYFWLRVGYRPLFRSQHGRDGFSVMIRNLQP
jgi:ribosomal protein S18 acetylase RimI-like enzyme